MNFIEWEALSDAEKRIAEQNMLEFIRNLRSFDSFIRVDADKNKDAKPNVFFYSEAYYDEGNEYWQVLNWKAYVVFSEDRQWWKIEKDLDI